MDAADKPTSAAGRKALGDPRIHRYYVRLTSEQNGVSCACTNSPE